jgi:teichoic acid glycerol-phosphate primase
MPKEKIAAVNTGMDSRLLDHLAPLCSLLDCPLFLTEEKNQQLTQKFYPNVSSFLIPTEEFSLFTLAEKYRYLIQSTFWDQSLIHLIKSAYPDVRFGYCPHGNSDKGHQKPMLEPLLWQDFAFFYGEHMVDRLKKQNLFKGAPPHIFTGNYRLAYYQKNKAFYDEIVNQELHKLDLRKKTILYAPTWKDDELSTSFFAVCKKLVQEAPSEINLIIKVHPLLEEMNPAEYYRALPELSVKNNILLLEDFPPIFPLLSKVDIFLGDLSSIGYDFTYFQRPMFFFNPFQKISSDHPSLYLHQCGTVIPDNEDIFDFIEKNSLLVKKEKQKEIWEYAFGKTQKKLTKLSFLEAVTQKE